jgi:hypothetical protein
MDDATKAPGADPYSGVDKMWSDAGVTWATRITEGEARRAARALWRIVGRKVRVPSIRPVWLREGWRRMVHDLSHRVHAWKSGPNVRPHAWNHVAWERAFVEHCIKKGWHLGALKAKPRAIKPKPDPKVLRAERIEARLKAWRSRLKRADTAIAKLERVRRARVRRIAKSAG